MCWQEILWVPLFAGSSGPGSYAPWILGCAPREEGGGGGADVA